MKKLKLIFGLIIILAACQVSSCGKEGDSPVDRVVVLLDEASAKTESITSINELSNVDKILSPEEVWQIINENSDYKLSKRDKEKLKKSYDKLMRTAYEKSFEFVTSESLKNAVKSQLELMLRAIDENIDRAHTLGDIRALN